MNRSPTYSGAPESPLAALRLLDVGPATPASPRLATGARMTPSLRSKIDSQALSRKYVVAIPRQRIGEFRALIRRAGNSFDQRVIYLEIAGYAELLEVRPEDGFLEV